MLYVQIHEEARKVKERKTQSEIKGETVRLISKTPSDSQRIREGLALTRPDRGRTSTIQLVGPRRTAPYKRRWGPAAHGTNSPAPQPPHRHNPNPSRSRGEAQQRREASPPAPSTSSASTRTCARVLDLDLDHRKRVRLRPDRPEPPALHHHGGHVCVSCWTRSRGYAVLLPSL
jgi:hypothetical protein